VSKPRNTSKNNLKNIILQAILGIAIFTASPSVPDLFAGGIQTLDTVEVTDSAENLVGSADSSNEGTVTPRQIEERPVSRTGEILETVPGLEISQHSGEGKANQYYLRGFQLDHGTDFATSVCGEPVNLPTHAHGQGYSDLNFMIPEVIGGIQYVKGPYFAENGDFSAAGAANMPCVNTLPNKIFKLEGGTDQYRRALIAGSSHIGSGDLLYALEGFFNAGPWDHPDNYRKLNGLLRYSWGSTENQFAITLMGYHGNWDATDQIAKRAIGTVQCRIVDGCALIDRFGSLDPSDGGRSYRYSAVGEWQRTVGDSVTKATLYAIDYGLDLWSDFTYFLNDPVNGDQIQQTDRRIVTGLRTSQTWLGKLGDHEMENTIGIQVRNDNIAKVALYHTADRMILETVSQDHVAQTSEAVYFQNRFQWMEKFRTIAGIRADFYQWHVISDNPLNSGNASDSIVSPKLTMIFGPWAKTEYYINAGYGFHSNDGRGTTITVDPSTGDPAQKVNGLVRAKGAEVGARSALIPHLQTELTVWILNLDSELTFSGDRGGTEAGPPSHRRGIEFANYYTPTPWLTIDADYAYSWSYFVNDPAGHYIPESPEGIASAGIFVNNITGWMGGTRLRYFGPRALTEDNSVRSSSATTVDGRIGYEFIKQWTVLLDVFNIFNAKVSDVEYYYPSRLQGEPPGPDEGGYNDIHLHPMNPREFRLTLVGKF